MSSSFDRAPRGAALETRQRSGVHIGTPLSGYLGSSRVVVAHSGKGWPTAFLGINGDGVGKDSYLGQYDM